MSKPGFIETQRVFADHLRNPESNPPPQDVAPRRMAIYVRLFHRNLESFLANGFPVAKSVLDRTQWHGLVQGFIHRHASETPYFMDIVQEFMAFLAADPVLDKPDWLLELCHFEWVKRSLKHSGEELPETEIDPHGDLLANPIVPSPLMRPLYYRYRVNEIGPNRIPRQPPEKPVWLIACRRRDDSVRVLGSNALTHRLLRILRPETFGEDAAQSTDQAAASAIDGHRQTTGGQALAVLAAEFPRIDKQRLHREGAQILERLRKADVLLGVRINPASASSIFSSFSARPTV